MKTGNLINIQMFFGLLVAGLIASNAATASSSVIPSGFLPGDQVASEISSAAVSAAKHHDRIEKPSLPRKR